MKIFNRSYLPESIKYNGKHYMYDAKLTESFERLGADIPHGKCIQVNVFSPRVKGVKDLHGNEYKPQVYIFSQVTTAPKSEATFLWKDKTGRGFRETISLSAILKNATKVNWDGVTLKAWAREAEEGDEWENRTEKYTCTSTSKLETTPKKQNDPVDHGKTFIPAKQIILRERDGSIDFNKQIRIGTYTNYYAANQRVRQLIGEYSDVCYDITFADGYHLTGSIDLEPKSFWDGNGSGNEPLSWHLKTFWTNVSKITLPYPDMTREDIDEAKTLIEKYQLSAAQETLPDFTKRTDFYMHDATPAMNERTATRLIEIAQLGMTEVGVAEFGIEDVMSGLYIERVWRDSPEQWNDYIEWVKEVKELKGLHKANLPANAAARQLVIDGKEVKSLYGFLYESFSEGNCIDTKEFNELLMLSLGQSCVINGMTIKRIGEKEIKPEIGELPAKNIVRYFEVYRQYLQDNGLDDDSNSITVESLIDFVENEIEKD